MEFQLSSTQEQISALAKKFAEQKIKPLIEKDEADERFRPELIAEMGALGLTGIATPEAYGGAGLGYQEYILAIEEIAAVSVGYAVSMAVSGLPQIILSLNGSNDQKQKYIPNLATGKSIGAFSLSEAFSGSDASVLRTVAKKVGDHYIVNGTKLWTTQADSAETLILMARTGGPDSPGAKGISAFILEKGMPGFSFGKREKKMGMNVSHTMEVVLKDVRIPKENLIGKEGEGFKVALKALDGGRITIAACALGVARSALELAATYSKQREQFGKSISEFQGISFLLADHRTSLEAAKLLVHQAAWLKDQNKPFTQEAAMAKLYATDMAMKLTTDAVQILGGAGYTKEFPLERYMREAKVLQIVEGTNQIQRMVVAKHFLQELKGT